MQSILVKIISGIIGLWLAAQFVPGVEFTGPWQILILAGAMLGLINFFIKPIFYINLVMNYFIPELNMVMHTFIEKRVVHRN